MSKITDKVYNVTKLVSRRFKTKKYNLSTIDNLYVQQWRSDKTGIAYVLKNNIGFILTTNTDFDPLHTKKYRLKINFMYIQEKYRRKGYGSFLLKHIEKKINKKHVGLVAFTTSPHAISLFFKQKYIYMNDDNDECAIFWKNCV
jgi:GNAT superfamily N-acetyltransferase